MSHNLTTAPPHSSSSSQDPPLITTLGVFFNMLFEVVAAVEAVLAVWTEESCGIDVFCGHMSLTIFFMLVGGITVATFELEVRGQDHRERLLEQIQNILC